MCMCTCMRMCMCWASLLNRLSPCCPRLYVCVYPFVYVYVYVYVYESVCVCVCACVERVCWIAFLSVSLCFPLFMSGSSALSVSRAHFLFFCRSLSHEPVESPFSLFSFVSLFHFLSNMLSHLRAHKHTQAHTHWTGVLWNVMELDRASLVNRLYIHMYMCIYMYLCTHIHTRTHTLSRSVMERDGVG